MGNVNQNKDFPEPHQSSQNWESMYSYMKKAETFHQPSRELASSFGIEVFASDYGSTGSVQISFTK
jgi:hypothetical protein